MNHLSPNQTSHQTLDQQLAQQLTQLLPLPAALDPTDLMYRAGYAAGQAAHARPSLKLQTRWLSMAAMIMITGLAGYQLGQRSLPTAVTTAAGSTQTDLRPVQSVQSKNSVVASTRQEIASRETALPDSPHSADHTAPVSRDDLPPFSWWLWAGLTFNQSGDSIQVTAFPMVGNELEPEQVLERLSLVSATAASVRRAGTTANGPERTHRLMTASDSADWISSY